MSLAKNAFAGVAFLSFCFSFGLISPPTAGRRAEAETPGAIGFEGSNLVYSSTGQVGGWSTMTVGQGRRSAGEVTGFAAMKVRE